MSRRDAARSCDCGWCRELSPAAGSSGWPQHTKAKCARVCRWHFALRDVEVEKGAVLTAGRGGEQGSRVQVSWGCTWAQVSSGAVPGSRGAPMMDNRDSLRYLMGHHEPLTLLVHVQALAFKSCQPPAFPETQQGHSSPCRGTAFFPVLHLSSLAHLCKRQELHLPLLHCYIYLHIFVVPLLFTFIFNVNLIIFIVLHLISL